VSGVVLAGGVAEAVVDEHASGTVGSLRIGSSDRVGSQGREQHPVVSIGEVYDLERIVRFVFEAPVWSVRDRLPSQWVLQATRSRMALLQQTARAFGES
jgi:hypothetical protein